MKFCEICGAALSWLHDHKDDFSGIDDGPYREKKIDLRLAKNSDPDAVSKARKSAWITRRTRYGEAGHR